MIETIVEKLALHTQEEIVYKNVEQENNLLYCDVASRTIGSELCLLLDIPHKSWMMHLFFGERDAGRKYLTDNLQLVLLSLGGIGNLMKELPAAARQPWHLAKAWYQRHYEGN